jgi:hypothetical protein
MFAFFVYFTSVEMFVLIVSSGYCGRVSYSLGGQYVGKVKTYSCDYACTARCTNGNVSTIYSPDPQYLIMEVVRPRR